MSEAVRDWVETSPYTKALGLKLDALEEERARLEAGVNKRKLGWPDYYFNKNLWEPVEVTMR